ncbi:MAG: 4-alpha-glucanotransferase [Bacteroidales bacterium]|nr:4-alpha-glucanotransferase [Bacteroidales bacterium]
MTHIEFNINYQTKWGEEIQLIGDVAELGYNDVKNAVTLLHKGGGNWGIALEFANDSLDFNYSYLVRENESYISHEWGKPRHFCSTENNSYRLHDHWQSLPPNNPFFSSAFTECLFSRPENKTSALKQYKQSLTFKVFAPTVPPHLSLGIIGNCTELGNWSQEKALKLSPSNFPEWKLTVNGAKLPATVDYKFVLIESDTNKIIGWEWTENRTLFIGKVKKNEAISINGLHFNNPLQNWKGTGVAIPVFSLRTKESFGIGEFNDLRKMVDWAVATGQKLIQILPINDTTMNRTWQDSYPYNSNSIFALHPVYLNPKKIGILKDNALMDEFTKKAIELNQLTEIDYEAVNQTKWNYFREIFKQEGAKTFKTNEYKAFFESNKDWLISYAAFCYLRDINKTPDYRLWETNSTFKQSEIDELCNPKSAKYSDIAIHLFLQFHLDKQLRESIKYAHNQQVILKGDIPIGISPTSVEAWTEPFYFNMNGQAGAPPDDFSVNGQNWGFPTYNWAEMEKDGYKWWKRRFNKMADYFDAYRIDHVLGFFRIWEVPTDAVHGLLGHFTPALPLPVSEIANYGLHFDAKRFTKPYIYDHTLHIVFGEYFSEVVGQFLLQKDNFEYELKKEYDTQQKIKVCFEGKNDPKSMTIREGLYSLVSDVLFVEDPIEKGKYHPRISAQHTFSYQALNDYEKGCFNTLYNDFFYNRHNDFWYQQSMKKLPSLISSTSMLVCAEDLGMIPKCVPAVMDQLQILSLEIQRMPKDERLEFGQTDYYPYLSVSTTSTHDMSTLRGWWEENGDKTQRYFNQILGRGGQAPVFCEPYICENIVRNHLWSPAMLVILPLQDWLSIDGDIRRTNPEDERINLPSNPRHYWRYRMHIYLEDLIAAETFNKKMKEMITQSGR